MATTAAGTPYVESSDLVANYPGVSLALANHIDTIGKVLQVVRATDTTLRSTSSTSFVDLTGMTVTITPEKVDSSILLLAFLSGSLEGTAAGYQIFGQYQITNAANTAISGAQTNGLGLQASAPGGVAVFLGAPVSLSAFDSPATLSAVTYKMRFKVSSASYTLYAANNTNTGQMFAIEVAA